MKEEQERFTATLSQLQRQEVMNRRPGQLRLEISGPKGLHTVTVRGTEITGGAATGNMLLLQHDDKVSRLHFKLLPREDYALLCDLGSTNGTRLGDALVKEASLRRGDTFSVGENTTITLLGIDAVDTPISTESRFGECYGQCSKMKEVFSILDRLASSKLNILIEGESGTGKELIARALHSRSKRSSGPFVVIDSTTLKAELVESTLFGHKKGAFTGATTTTTGLLEEATGGTLFIDELGELPLSLQPKLLRALQERRFLPVGETRDYRAFDTRVIAAANKNLQRMVNSGGFRIDLYFRVCQYKQNIPPLRERGKVDIIFLANHFLEKHANRRRRLTREASNRLASHHWPGNVRELENVIETSLALADADALSAEDIHIQENELFAVTHDTEPNDSSMSYAETLLLPYSEAVRAFRRVYVLKVLADTKGNKTEAARRCDMGLSTLKDILNPRNSRK